MLHVCSKVICILQLLDSVFYVMPLAQFFNYILIFFILTDFLPILTNIERNVLKYPTLIMNLSISLFHFLLYYLGAPISNTYKYKVIISSELTFYYYEVVLFIPSKIIFFLL